MSLSGKARQPPDYCEILKEANMVARSTISSRARKVLNMAIAAAMREAYNLAEERFYIYRIVRTNKYIYLFDYEVPQDHVALVCKYVLQRNSTWQKQS